MSSNNINDVSEYIKSKFKELLEEDISDYELDIISKSIQISQKEVPTVKTILSDMIAEGIRLKSGLEYMIFRLKDKRKIISLKYNPEYNKLFTILTRQGRPSKAAIDCEIMYTNPELYSMSTKLGEFDELVQFVNDQIQIIDMIIRNLESRHYDL